MLMVSHDLPALDPLVDRVIAIERGSMIAKSSFAEVIAIERFAFLFGGIRMSFLNIKNLSAFYGKAQALSNIDITVEQGEIIAIVGANGAGEIDLDAGDGHGAHNRDDPNLMVSV